METDEYTITLIIHANDQEMKEELGKMFAAIPDAEYLFPRIVRCAMGSVQQDILKVSASKAEATEAFAWYYLYPERPFYTFSTDQMAPLPYPVGRREEWESHLKKNDVDRLLAYLKDTEIFLKENRYPPAESQEILEKMVRELVQCLKNLHIQNHLTFEEPATPLYHTSCQLILHAQELLNQWKSRCEDTQGNRVSSSIEAALQYMESHLNQPLTLSEVAEHVYMSTSYLSKLFKEQLHENFNDYVYRRKMEHAAKLLTETETSVEHIAENLGFSSANYFIRRFKKYYGTTPSVFRNNHRKS